MRLFYFVSIVVIALLSIGSVYSQGDVIDAEGEDVSRVSYLLEATSVGDLEAMRRALDNGEDIDSINVNGWSAASFAVAASNMEALRFLIDEGIDLNIANNEGFTPLMLAALQADKEMVEVLLANNADPSITSVSGETAYSSAINSKRLINAAIILEASVIRAMVNDDPELVLESVRNGAYVNIRSSGGWNPLIYSSAHGNLAAVKELVGLGANVNHVENEGWSPLHFAALNNYSDIVSFLLESNADYGILNVQGKTARDLAVEHELTDVVSTIDNFISKHEL